MSENKVKYGLQDVYYAPFTVQDGVITYEKPIPIPGGVELSLEPQGDMIQFFADNVLYYSASNNQGYEGTLTIARVPEQFAVDALGEQMDADDGVISEMANAKQKPFALLFQFEGDVKATRHVIYNCTASRPTVASSTKTDSVEPATDELTFLAAPRTTDTAVKTKTTSTTPAAIYDSWFDQVYQKAGSNGAGVEG